MAKRGVPLRPDILAAGGIGLRVMAATLGAGEPVPLFAGVPVRLCRALCAIAAAIAGLICTPACMYACMFCIVKGPCGGCMPGIVACC